LPFAETGGHGLRIGQKLQCLRQAIAFPVRIDERTARSGEVEGAPAFFKTQPCGHHQ